MTTKIDFLREFLIPSIEKNFTYLSSINIFILIIILKGFWGFGVLGFWKTWALSTN